MSVATLVARARYRFKDEGLAKFEMCLGESQIKAYYQHGVVQWYDPEDIQRYRCNGLVPSTFPRAHGKDGGVPFKYSEENHLCALEGYCRAGLKGAVTEPPKCLLIAQMDLDTFDECIEKGSIVVHAGMKTISFMLEVNEGNYPTFESTLMGSELMVPAFQDMTAQLRQKKEQYAKRHRTK